MNKKIIVTSVKNEAPFLMEWIAYHRLIGFDEIIVYYNDCVDGTVELLRALAHLGVVRAYENLGEGDLEPQVAAFTQARRLRVVQEAAWAIILDCDEFINIKIQDGRIESLLGVLPDADAIPIQMRHFGSSGRIFLSEDLVIRQFRMASQMDHPDNLIVKTLHKMGGVFASIAMHTPAFPSKPGIVPRFWNGSGVEIPPHMYDNKRFTRINKEWSGTDLVQVNHYAVKSLDCYLMKVLKGVGSGAPDRYSARYWADRDTNDVEDLSIQRWVEPILELCAQWRADAGVADAVALARSRMELAVFEAIRGAPPFADSLAARICKG